VIDARDGSLILSDIRAPAPAIVSEAQTAEAFLSKGWGAYSLTPGRFSTSRGGLQRA
jgi:hypothetical protein